MTSPISGISFAMPTIGLAGITDVAGVSGIAASSSTGSTSGASAFAPALAVQLHSRNAGQRTADSLALAASTGDLQDAHDYMIASNEARLATDTVVTLKNSAIAAFTEIMRMPV